MGTSQESNYLNTEQAFFVYDLLGKEVLHEKINRAQITITRNNLPNGIFLYQLKKNGLKTATGKIIIQ